MIEDAQIKKNSDALHILVVGAGALGSGLAAYFQAIIRNQPVVVQLFNRTGPVQQGFSVEQESGITSEYIPGKSDSGAALKGDAANYPPRAVLGCVKAFDLEAVIGDWLPNLIPGRDVFISLCNGYLRPIFEHLPNRIDSQHARQVLRWGITSIGVTALGNHRYAAVNLREGIVQIGGIEAPPGGTIVSLAETSLARFLPQFRIVADINSVAAEKWICNTALNTLCGAHRLPSNALALDFHEAELQSAFNEAYDCATSELFPEAMILPREELWLNLRSLIQATGHNRNSMAADVLQNRRHEDSFLAGACHHLPPHSTLSRLRRGLP